MDKAKLIELLNGALRIEYNEIFMYSRQSDMVKEKEISEKFEKFGRMEVRHADNIAMQISLLGGEPKWEFAYLEVKESKDEMLRDSLEREKRTIQLYKSLIDFTDKEGYEQLRLIIKGIKSEEEDHFTIIKDLLGKGK